MSSIQATILSRFCCTVGKEHLVVDASIVVLFFIVGVILLVWNHKKFIDVTTSVEIGIVDVWSAVPWCIVLGAGVAGALRI